MPVLAYLAAGPESRIESLDLSALVSTRRKNQDRRVSRNNILMYKRVRVTRVGACTDERISNISSGNRSKWHWLLCAFPFDTAGNALVGCRLALFDGGLIVVRVEVASFI